MWIWWAGAMKNTNTLAYKVPTKSLVTWVKCSHLNLEQKTASDVQRLAHGHLEGKLVFPNSSL